MATIIHEGFEAYFEMPEKVTPHFGGCRWFQTKAIPASSPVHMVQITSTSPDLSAIGQRPSRQEYGP